MDFISRIYIQSADPLPPCPSLEYSLFPFNRPKYGYLWVASYGFSIGCKDLVFGKKVTCLDISYDFNLKTFGPLTIRGMKGLFPSPINTKSLLMNKDRVLRPHY